jgi:L-threonylcarbamoyladenylate synthase
VLTDLEGRIDMVIDGGPAAVGVESTVVDLTGDEPTILRPGAVTLEMLREVLPGVRHAAATARPGDQAMPAPGMLSKHYAPRAPLTLYRGDRARATSAIEADARAAAAAGQRVGILEADDTTAARLYAALRELDERGVDVILACDLADDTGISRAVRDRLRRAAARIVDLP